MRCFPWKGRMVEMGFCSIQGKLPVSWTGCLTIGLACCWCGPCGRHPSVRYELLSCYGFMQLNHNLTLCWQNSNTTKPMCREVLWPLIACFPTPRWGTVIWFQQVVNRRPISCGTEMLLGRVQLLRLLKRAQNSDGRNSVLQRPLSDTSCHQHSCQWKRPPSEGVAPLPPPSPSMSSVKTVKPKWTREMASGADIHTHKLESNEEMATDCAFFQTR